MKQLTKWRESPRSSLLFLVILITTAVLLWYFVSQSQQKSSFMKPVAETVQSVPATITTTVSISPVVEKPTEVTYVVKTNDWLSKIAVRECTTVAELVSKNAIKNPDLILVGQTLKFSKVEDCKAQVPVVKKSSAKSPVTSNEVEPESVFSKLAKNTSDDTECQNAGWKITDFSEKTMAVANCIKRKYGSMISLGVKTIDPRISPLEVVARMIVESKGNPNALNRGSQCKGLMQLQPGTASDYGVNLSKIYDPKENIFGGIRVMSAYTYRMNNGDEDRGRVAYNAGPYNKIFRSPKFDPSTFPYTIAVRNVRHVLDSKNFTVD